MIKQLIKFLIFLGITGSLSGCGQNAILVQKDAPAYRSQFEKSLQEISNYYRDLANRQDEIRYEIIRVDNQCSIGGPLCVDMPSLAAKPSNNNIHICLTRNQCSKRPAEKRNFLFQKDPQTAIEPIIARIEAFSKYLQALANALSDDKNEALTLINTTIDSYQKTIENYCKFAGSSDECKKPSNNPSFSSVLDYRVQAAKAVTTLLGVLQEIAKTNMQAREIRDILNKSDQEITAFLDETYKEIEGLEQNLAAGQYAMIKSFIYFDAERNAATMRGEERIEAAKRYRDIEKKQEQAEKGQAEVLGMVKSMEESHKALVGLANGNLNEEQRKRAAQATFQNFQETIESAASVLGLLMG